jgi:hypothetical protein
VAAAEHLPPASPQGASINFFSFGGGHYRTCHQHPPRGPPSTSSTSVVATVGPTASTPRGLAIDVFSFGGGCYRTCRQHPLGARHQHFQLRWWLLLDLPPTPCRGPPSMSSASVVAAVGPAASTPLGAHHRRLQLWWWPLPDLPPAPPGAHHRCLLALMVGAPGSLAPIGPTCRFATSPEVGPGASVDTLKIGYPRKQALSQDKKQGVHPHTAT